MSIRKRFLLLGSILLTVALLFTYSSIHAPTASAAVATVSCPPSESQGANNDWVKVIQFRLNGLVQNAELSFPQYPLTPNGNFTTNTYNAVSYYQKYFMGITDGGGVVGDRTWGSLGLCSGPGLHDQIPSGYTYGGANCPTTEGYGVNAILVNAIQHMVNVTGAYGWLSTTYPNSGWWQLGMDGVFGSKTQDGVINFQSANDLPQDGVVGNKTWAAMGMCYG